MSRFLNLLPQRFTKGHIISSLFKFLNTFLVVYLRYCIFKKLFSHCLIQLFHSFSLVMTNVLKFIVCLVYIFVLSILTFSIESILCRVSRRSGSAILLAVQPRPWSAAATLAADIILGVYIENL